MNDNIIFKKFRFNKEDFDVDSLNIIEGEEAIVYTICEKKIETNCPYCDSSSNCIHDYNWRKIKVDNGNPIDREILRIKRIRYECRSCGKTFTRELLGLKKNSTISDYTLQCIHSEFFTIQSFDAIGKRYGLSPAKVIEIFDDFAKFVPRRQLTKSICIDEKHFEGDTESKYCVVISDFETGEILDVVAERKYEYLADYFRNIPFSERNRVKYIISDMYDGYEKIQINFFPKSTFIIDHFHVIKLVSEVVRKIRIQTRENYAFDKPFLRYYMKHNWKMFQLKIDSPFLYEDFTSEKYNIRNKPHIEIVMECLKLNTIFFETYNIYQELLKYDRYETFTEALNFLERIARKLNMTGEKINIAAASSLLKWKISIANGLVKNKEDLNYSNSKAEGNNGLIQRIIDCAFGYFNFARFRKRVLLIKTYSK